MPFVALIIAVILVLVLVALVMVLGGIGMVSRGPKPNEGDKSTG